MSKAASAFALRKGLWRDKQGFSPACPGQSGRRTPLYASAKTLCVSRRSLKAKADAALLIEKIPHL